ncbi:spermidine/putrescine ABC transporter substrate-binding protein [Candidatus Magnetomorum sp. HK-1]|nr:spermidine/putrescine ABC transporter substrate-binding protein [Candidatus Magnetomorum sp. HK-1]
MNILRKRLFHSICIFFGLLCIALFSKTLFAEETLRMLVWEPYLAGKLPQESFIKLVKEKFNVKLKLDIKYVTSDDDFHPALRDDKTDVIVLSHCSPKDKRYQLIKLNLTLPLDLKNIPNYPHVLPSLQSADYCSENGNVYCVPVARGPYGLVYNTNIFKQAPDSWNIFWDPKYKGKYSLGRDQYEQNVYFTALAMGYSSKDMYNYKKLNTPEFQKKLGQLAKNAHSLWVGTDQAEDLKGLAFAASWGVSLPGLKKSGEIWKLGHPKEGTTAWLDNFMLSALLEKRPLLKRIAEAWINYTLTNEYQEYIVRFMGAEPITTTIKNTLTKDEIKTLGLDNPSLFNKKYILFPTLEKTDRKGLKRLWKKAMSERK